jgi:hypothetical protein
VIKPFNLATMAIADKVNNYIQTYFYKIQLVALQTAAKKIGGAFVQHPHLRRFGCVGCAFLSCFLEDNKMHNIPVGKNERI